MENSRTEGGIMTIQIAGLSTTMHSRARILLLSIRQDYSRQLSNFQHALTPTHGPLLCTKFGDAVILR